MEPHEYHTNLILLLLRTRVSIATLLPDTVWVYLHPILRDGLRKTHVNRMRNGSSIPMSLISV